MKRWALRCVTLALAAPFGGAGAARAQGIASPGPLSQPHASLDGLTRCLTCHETGRQLSGRKCLACHTTLATRIQADRGFHAGTTKHGAELACATCHGEHNGRPFRLVRWEGGAMERFDHAQAGWPLVEAHARRACTDCHRAGLIADAAARADRSLSVEHTFLGLATSCVSCHLDEHRGRTSRQCEDCHTQTEWKPAPRFDHARTHFPLLGRHRDVRCAQCHTERHEPASGPGGARDTMFVDFRTSRPADATCTGCHTSPHRDRSRMGRCEACHTVDGWFVLADSLRTNFEHTRTGFPLNGAHGAARCEACHLSSPGAALSSRVALVRANFQRPLARQPMRFARCDDCHADVHRGELSAARGDCVACHDDARFSPTQFTGAMHDRTAFPLAGAHGAVPCVACHTPLPGGGTGHIRFRIADHRCAACHRDPHAGQFEGRTCESCHGVEAWARVTFDHAQTRYPLRGAHLAARCSACHTRPAGNPHAPVRFRGLPQTCGSAGCHTDPHGDQFAGRVRGSECTTCHTEDRWRPAGAFDHNRDTDWPLDRAHQRAPCAACHKAPAPGQPVPWRPLPHRCEDCHR